MGKATAVSLLVATRNPCGKNCLIMRERRVTSLVACLCWLLVLACHGPPYFAEALLNSQKTVVVAGATGYIGRAVVRESVKRGYHTVALVRDRTKLETEQGQSAYRDCFRGASVVECNVQDSDSLRTTLSSLSPQVDTIISCLASPSGIKRDVYAIDYQATLNCLKAGQHASARHFVLLSAFCCRNPLLQLQQAKLKFEAELQAQSYLTYSIVRPTAYFKSISAQFESIRGGSPHVLFGDAVTRCNPIAESELAEFMMDCLIEEEKTNKILNIGGPDTPLTNKMLGEMMFKAVGKEPKFRYAPLSIFDYIIRTFQFLATVLKSEGLEDAVETGRIGKYYATEDMLTTDSAEKYGTITVQDHYNRIATKGQEDSLSPFRATAAIGSAIAALPAFSAAAILIAYCHNSPVLIPQDFSMMLAALQIH